MQNTLTTRYVGGAPKQEGNYLAFNLHSAEQFIVKVYQDGEGVWRALSGFDHQVHDLNELNLPNIRWVHIEDMTKDEMDKFLTSPVVVAV